MTKDGVNEEYANAIRTYLALAIGRIATAVLVCKMAKYPAIKVPEFFHAKQFR